MKLCSVEACALPLHAKTMCATHYLRTWRLSNGVKVQEYKLKVRYGMAPGDYERLLAEQGGACAICSSSDLLLVVDHCHVSLAVRALLCSPCNVGLGQMKDDPDRLMAAAAYLLQHTDALGATA